MSKSKLNFWKTFIIIASALIMTLGFGLLNLTDGQESVLAEETSLVSVAENLESEATEQLPYESPDTAGWGTYAIYLPSASFGTVVLQAYDASLFGRGWVTINEGGVQTGWLMSEDWVELKITTLSPDTGFTLDYIKVSSSISGTNKNISSTKYFYNYSVGSTFYGGGNVTVSVNFKQLTYPIYYNLDGGYGVDNPSTYYYNPLFATNLNLSAPTKLGYTFTGWTGSNGSTPQTSVSIPACTTGSVSYTANWTPNTYVITLNKGSGIGGTSMVNVTYMNSIPSISVPSQSGYDFSGYYTSENGRGTPYYNYNGYSQITRYVLADNLTLYAYWVPKYYTVTLNQQGGSGGTTSVQVQSGSSMPSITVPTKLGYTFNGYFENTNNVGTKYYNANGTSAITWNKTNNATIYAGWTLNVCNLTVSKDDGISAFSYYSGSWHTNVQSGSETDINGLTTLEFKVLDSQILTGFVWSGWEISGSAGVDYDFDGGTTATSKQMSLIIYKTITVKATTKIGISISCVNNSTGSFTANGAGGSVKIGSGEYLATSSAEVLRNTTTTISSKGNYAYTFWGFYTSFDSDGGIGDSLSYQTVNAGTENQYYTINLENITEPQNYYAVYEIECYDLNLYAHSTLTNQYNEIPDSTGGVVSINTQTGGATDYGHMGYTLAITINAVANTGYKFIGWYDTYAELIEDANNNLMISSEINYSFLMEEYDTDFYAKFIKTHTVTLVSTTGISSVSIENQNGTTVDFYYGESIGKIIAVEDEVRYTWANWEVTNGTAPSGTTIQLNGREISGLKMDEYDFELTAYATPRKFNLSIYSVYNDSGTLISNYTNGTNYGGLVSTSDQYSATAYYIDLKVDYNSNDVLMTAFAKSGYTFMGWFKDVDFVTNTYSFPYLQGTTSGQTINIEPMDIDDLVYYAVFTKNYKVSIYGDDGVYNLSLTNGSSVEYETGKYYLETYFYYNQQILDLSATLNFGFDFDCWVLGSTSTLLTNFVVENLVQTTEFFMGAGDCTLTATTLADQYTLHVKSYYTDDGTYHYGDQGGKIQIASQTITSEDEIELDFQQRIAITAYPEDGYCFVGWFKTQALTYPNVNIYSSDTSVLTEPMQANESGLTYIAVFIKEYTLTLSKWPGIDSVSTTKESYYYGESVGINAIVQSGFEWDLWFVNGEVTPLDFIETLQAQTIRINGNIELIASTKAQKYVLDVVEKYELTNGTYATGTVGGSVSDGQISYGADILSIVTTNVGFEFAGYYRDEELTNSYGGEIMPQNDIMLYAKFQRIAYALTTANYFTSLTDNSTLISGITGGQIYSLSTLKYNCQTTLSAVCNEGFILKGFYKDSAGTIVYKLGDQCDISGNTYSTQSEAMGVDGLSYYAIFERQTYTITLIGEGATITIPSSAYYGKSITFQVEYNDAYIVSAINIYNSSNQSEIVSYTNNQFNMPNFNIIVETVSTERNYEITFNPNKGTFSNYSSGVDVSGNMAGSIAYGTNNYIYYTNLYKTNSANGAPLPVYNGYKLLGYNTDIDALGDYYITYDNGFIYGNWDIKSSQILYAIWEIDAPVLNIELVNGNETAYTGEYHTALKVSVLNLISGKEYVYSWYNGVGELCSETTTTLSYNILSLRNVNESGSYYCVVTIVGETASTQSNTLAYTITPITLTIDIGDKTFIGSCTYNLSASEISGLLTLHRFVSGYLRFDSSTSDIVYNQISQLNYQVIVEVYDNGSWTTEQNGDLIDNYTVVFDSVVTVKSISHAVKINIASYERIIDEISYNEIKTDNILSNAIFTFEYASGFYSINTVDNGVFTNYFDYDNINQTLTITFTEMPDKYKIYSLSVNNTDISYDVSSTNENSISFILASGLLSGVDDYYLANIKIYLTNSCLVEYDYNFIENEVETGYATFDTDYQKAIIINGDDFTIPTEPTRNGFTFGGWYFDNTTFANQVPTVWTKTGNATVYAKWVLNDLTAQNVNIEVYDNSVLTEILTRDYNGNAYEIKFVPTNISINYEVVWYKNYEGVWKTIETSKISDIKDVINSGEYSLKLKATYNGQTKYLAYGLKTVAIDITPYDITSGNLTKVYDSTTDLGNTVFETGVNGEQLRISGEYSSANVKLISSIPSLIAINNFGLEAVNGSLVTNYNLTNTSLYGIITPFAFEINKVDTAVYTGVNFSKDYLQTINLPNSLTQQVSYTFNTNGANVGEYTPTDATNILSFVFNNSETGLIANNYTVTINSASSVEITKANLQDVYYSNQTTIYNATTQMITVKNGLGEVYTNANLPTGATSIEYWYEDTLVTGFVDAGTYLVNVLIYGDSNHNDWAETATFIISKAIISYEFLYNGDPITTIYLYNSTTDMYSGLTISTTNESGVDCYPVVTKQVLQDSVEVFEVKNVNEYVFKALMDDSNFMVQGKDSQTFRIIAKQYVVADDVTFENAENVYNGLNQATDFTNNNLILPEGIEVSNISIKLFDGTNYNTVSTAQNVGVYKIIVGLQSQDLGNWQLDTYSVSAYLTITQFEITNSNTTVSANKTYNGLTDLPTTANLIVTLAVGRTEQISFSGSFASANVGNDISINSIAIEDTNYTLAVGFTGVANITESDLTINLYDNIVESTYIQKTYTGSAVQFIINNSNYKTYTQGFQNSEYAIITFETVGTDGYLYPFSDIVIATNYCYMVSIAFYDKNNSEIVNGLNNYNMQVNGGIELIADLTVAEFIGLDNNVYQGIDLPIQVILSKYNSVTFSVDSITATYNYATSQFINDSTLLVVNDLVLTISDAGTTLKNAGEYTLTLTSPTDTYIFNVDGDNEYSKTVTVEKAPITFEINPTMLYGETLAYSNATAITGVNGEVFYCNFSYNGDSTSLAVGTYDLSTSNILYELNTSETSTGNFDNYEITITGTLTVTAKTISITADYSSLDLTYSSEDQIATINAVLVQFLDGANPISIDEADYTKKYYIGEDEVNQIINAGTYTVKFFSTNYVFSESYAFNFIVKQKNMTIDFTQLPELVYNGTQQTPISATLIGTFSADSNKMGLSITYGGNSTVINAGDYTATASITNANYTITNTTTYDFTLLAYTIEVPTPTTPLFTKHYAETDPTLEASYNVLGENVLISFTRETGETVGKYALLNPQISSNNSVLTRSNFAVSPTFNEDNEGFEILAYTGVEGQLTIEIISDIEIVYNGIEYYNLELTDLNSSQYVVKDYWGNVLDSSDYELSATFNFYSSTAKNAGEYQFYLYQSSSSTHLEDIYLENNNDYKFIINKVELTITQVAMTTITKQYDKTSEAILTGVLNLGGIVGTDNVVLIGIYTTAGVNQVNVGDDYTITLSLQGTDSANYTLNALDITAYTGDITPREITVIGLNSEDTTAFDKEYDKTSIVDISKLTLNNVLSGDSVTFSGKYTTDEINETSSVYADAIIIFEVSNSNYTIAKIDNQNYTGNINPKTLTLTEDSILDKIYDGTNILTISNLQLQGILSGDDVSILSATYALATVGTHDITITLDGTESTNYTIDTYQGTIINRVITIIYNYNEEDLANDGIALDYTETSTTAFYGTSLNDIVNGGKSLPIVTRVGYTFGGWFIDETYTTQFYASTVIGNDAWSQLENLAPSYEINLYAKWVVNTYEITIEIMTEEINTSNFAYSNVGGNFDLDNSGSGEIYLSTQVLTFDYYSSHNISILENLGFNLNGIYKNNVLETSDLSYDLSEISSDMTITIKFERELYQITLDTNTTDTVSGFDNTYNVVSGIATKSIKYQSEIYMPVLVRQGYSFMGWSLTDNGDIVYSEDTDNSYQSLEDTTLYAIWQIKSFNLYFDFNDGTLDGEYVYQTDVKGDYIVVTYGNAIGTLPSLDRVGYLHDGWSLLINSEVIEENVTAETIWNFDSENTFVLKATWIESASIVDLDSLLNIPTTNDTDFDNYYANNNETDTFADPISLTYSIDGSESTTYTDSLTVYTNNVLSITAIMTHQALGFEGWYIDGTLLSSGSQTINGTIFEVNGQDLKISNIVWGNNCPLIEACYNPVQVEVNLSIENLQGTITTFGIFEENGTNYTLAGAIIQIDYTINAGYVIDLTTELPALGQNDELNGTYSISNVVEDVYITIAFEKQSNSIIVNYTGYPEGVESLLYSINGGEYLTYTDHIGVYVDDILNLKLILKYGYEILVDGFSIVGDENATITDLGNYLEENANVYEKLLEDFVTSFNLNIDISRIVYTVDAGTVIKIAENDFDFTTPENGYTIQDNTDTDRTSFSYKEIATFGAIIETYLTDIDNVTVEKYDFLGWYLYQNLQFTLLSESLEFDKEILENTTLYAMFKLKTYTVSFELNNEDEGTLKSAVGGNPVNPQTISFGENLKNTVVAVPNSGCVFDKWVISYDISSTTIEINSDQLTSTEITNLVCNVTCTAYFETFDINVRVIAEFNDDAEEDISKISVTYGSLISLLIDFSTKTLTDINLTANATDGYSFVNWSIGSSSQTYIIKSSSISQDKLSAELNIMFNGDDTITDYTITAVFERTVYQITAQLMLDDGNESGGGVIANDTNYFTGSSLITTAKYLDTVEIYIYTHYGYYIDINRENLVELITGSNVNYTFEDVSDELDEDSQAVFSGKYKLTITDLDQNLVISINAERNETTIYFYEQNFQAINMEDKYVLTSVTATVKYGTDYIEIEDSTFLTPTNSGYIFQGWSITKYTAGIIINANGNIVNSSWQDNVEELYLYPIWEQKKVKIDVNINPQNAIIDDEYYDELFNNLTTSKPIKVGYDFYFFIGATFGISFPEIKTGFTFTGYQILVYNEADQSFDWQTVNINSTDFLTTEFTIEDYINYEYSKATNATELTDYEDGTLYINLEYAPNVTIISENYYVQNRISTIGGTATIQGVGTSGYVESGETITIIATPQSGYSLKHLIINGEIVETQTLTTSLVITEPTSIIVVYVGNNVLVTLGTSENGHANAITGGNVETINDQIYYHVGDIIMLDAESSVGYGFANKWNHSINGDFQNSSYTLIAGDDNGITLTPIFDEKDIQVEFLIVGKSGTVSNDNITFTITPSGNNEIYSYISKYFSSINVQINANVRHEFSSIKMRIGTVTTDVTSLMNDNVFFITSDYFENTSTIVFEIRYTNIYWYEILTEKGYLVETEGELSLTRDLFGSGKADDPYRIETIDDFTIWAYLINHNIMQTDTQKFGYNSSNTYYEVNTAISFLERYWTPIGTTANPFNGIVYLYEARTDILVDKYDSNYPYTTLFDNEVVILWNGLFGCLGETAQIYEIVKNYENIIIIVSIISGLIILAIIVVVIINKKHKNNMERYKINKNPFA